MKCFINLTVNRYADIPGSDLAHSLWIPTYSPEADDRLAEFVNDLGRKWFDFLESAIGPSSDDPSTREHENTDFLIDSRIIPKIPPSSE